MATWVSIKLAAKFPHVIAVYGRAGRGQGTGQGIIATGPPSANLVSAPKGFLRTVQIFFQGETVQNASVPTIPSWLRKRPLSNLNDWQDCQVDVTAIPGVRSLRKDGRLTLLPN
jgi:hypothetical protein